MTKIISLPFEFRGKEYYTLIRARSTAECTTFKITIMNGELEQALHGDNTLEYRDGYFVANMQGDGSESSGLKRTVLNALEEYLASHPIED